MEDEGRCSLPQPHLRPVQKSSCHLTRLVAVIVDSLAGRERLCDGGWAGASPFRLINGGSQQARQEILEAFQAVQAGRTALKLQVICR